MRGAISLLNYQKYLIFAGKTSRTYLIGPVGNRRIICPYCLRKRLISNSFYNVRKLFYRIRKKDFKKIFNLLLKFSNLLLKNPTNILEVNIKNNNKILRHYFLKLPSCNSEHNLNEV